VEIVGFGNWWLSLLLPNYEMTSQKLVSTLGTRYTFFSYSYTITTTIARDYFFFFGACCNYVLTSMVGRWISDLEPALLGGFKVNLFRNSAPELESAWKMEGLEDIRRNSFWVVKRPIFSSKSVSFLGTPKTNGELDTQPPMNLARRRWDETPQGRFWP